MRLASAILVCCSKIREKGVPPLGCQSVVEVVVWPRTVMCGLTRQRWLLVKLPAVAVAELPYYIPCQAKFVRNQLLGR